jgi:alcohol dehydrogenase class IV
MLAPMGAAAKPRYFFAPTRIVSGLGARASISEELERLDARRIAVVADAAVLDAGLVEGMLAGVTGPELIPCGAIEADPSVEEAEVAAEKARATGCDGVLAIGGGSAIGAGKVVSITLANGEASIRDIWKREGKAKAPVPCVAVPTTAGSGSEVSNALVLHSDDAASVVVIRGDGFAPSTAILDGDLLATLPERPMIHAGLDALSHALEALWAKRATRFTDAFAFAAADDIFEALPEALESRRPEVLQRLLEAATMANLSCGPSELAAVHALASASAVELPHGYQVGVLLPHVAEFNLPELSPRAAEVVGRLRPLYERIGFDPSFAAGELDGEQAEAMVGSALGNPFLENNRRPVSEADLRTILDHAGAAGA